MWDAVRSVVFAGAGAVVLAGSAMAQDVPDLVGTWKGNAQAVYLGQNPYRLPDSDAPTFGSDEMEFIYVIDKQEGTRFAGHMEGKATETLIGALQPPDFGGGVFLDDDGVYPFTLRDENTIDFCYFHHNSTSKVVACFTVTRQP